MHNVAHRRAINSGSSSGRDNNLFIYISVTPSFPAPRPPLRLETRDSDS